MPLPRVVIGGVLRDVRLQKQLTLRTVAEAAPAALGYVSEVERGIKEPSSEVLGGIVAALGIPLSELFREVSFRMQVSEQLSVAPIPVDSVRQHS
ncbi:helix-turn-helix transcriptional regulator [Leucobacter sp. cx-169]|nr:helix-turn-helix transcriptional regulator [Leucobacter sp. cx-169]MBC9927247.1 helix-turn-helix transcriptional regulator [Leucobacter sp. cx-169]